MKKEKIIDKLFIIYCFLFIFTMINKEFLLFWNLDLRFILLPLGIFLFAISFFKMKNKEEKSYEDKLGKYLIAFYLFAFISNVSWIWNGIEINQNKFINEMILLTNILISILVFYRYKNRVKQEKINLFVVISAIVLMTSMILVSCGFSLKEISGSSNVPYMYVQSEKAPDHKNIFGGGFRPAGYASDPNYATLLLLIACISTLKLKINVKSIHKKMLIKIPLLIFFIIGIGLACSKTILAACIVGLLGLLLWRYIKPTEKMLKIFCISFILCVILANIFIAQIPAINQYMPSTLTTRFKMWDNALELFLKSPLIGSGITSFRSYYDVNHWYVQCHSTYWQILSEMGLVGLLLFIKILYDVLNKNQNQKSNYFLLFVYSIYAITSETIALQFAPFLLYIMNINLSDNQNKEGKEEFKIFIQEVFGKLYNKIKNLRRK